MTLAFIIAALVAVVSTLLVITRVNAVHALLFLFALIAIASMFGGNLLGLFYYLRVIVALVDRSRETHEPAAEDWRGSMAGSVALAVLLGLLVLGVFIPDPRSAGPVPRRRACRSKAFPRNFIVLVFRNRNRNRKNRSHPNPIPRTLKSKNPAAQEP